jgi:hypothetical protein
LLRRKVDLVVLLISGSLDLRWTETGGPIVLRPSGTAFGIRVIMACVEGQLDGKVEFKWREEGLSCAIRVPHNPQADIPGDTSRTAQPFLPKKATLTPVDRARARWLLKTTARSG